MLDEFCTKHQALSVATATLKKIKSYHILSTINAYGKEKWLVVSEYDLTYDDAMQVMESINSDKYSDSEIELIVSEAIPFDIRLG